MLVAERLCLRERRTNSMRIYNSKYLGRRCYLCCIFRSLVSLQAYGTLPRHFELSDLQHAPKNAGWS